MTRSLLAALLTTFLILPGAVPAQSRGKSKGIGKARNLKGIPGYKKQLIHGFTLLVHDEVYKHNEDSAWRRKPLDVLELELATIIRRLPERTVKVLKRLIIWVQWEDRSNPAFGKAVALYLGVTGRNPAATMLAKGKHPLKANAIDIINMKSLTREHQPGVKLERCVLLHEMAHAVHFQLFGANNGAIKAAYKAAMARHLYDTAQDVYGRTLRMPYATTNEKEYFAELTCAYMDKLHYFPFTPEDLKKHDAQGYRIMELTWGKRKTIDAAIARRRDRQAQTRYEAASRMAKAGKKKQAATALKRLLEELPQSKSAPSAQKLLQALEAAGSQ